MESLLTAFVIVFSLYRFLSGVWSGFVHASSRKALLVLSHVELPPCQWLHVSPRKWTSGLDRRLDTASDLKTARHPKLF